MTARDWIFYWNEDGEPWAIFLHGHDHDLRTIKSPTVKEEMRRAWVDGGMDDDRYFCGNLNIGRWWMRDEGRNSEEPDHPWHWCDKDDEGAIPITGAKFA